MSTMPTAETVEKSLQEASKVQLRDLVKKLIPESIGKAPGPAERVRVGERGWDGDPVGEQGKRN